MPGGAFLLRAAPARSSGGGYVKNMDAPDQPDLGAAIRVVAGTITYTVPLRGVRDDNAQVAHIVKIGEDGFGSSSTAAIRLRPVDLDLGRQPPRPAVAYIELQVTHGTSKASVSAHQRHPGHQMTAQNTLQGSGGHC
jgi:hypothetical protein